LKFEKFICGILSHRRLTYAYDTLAI